MGNKYVNAMNIKVFDEQRDYIKRLAQQKKTTTSDVVRIMINKYMDKHPDGNTKRISTDALLDRLAEMHHVDI